MRKDQGSNTEVGDVSKDRVFKKLLVGCNSFEYVDQGCAFKVKL